MIALFPEILSLANARDLEKLSIAVRSYFLGKAGHAPKLAIDDLVEGVGIQLQQAPFQHYGAIVVRDEKGSPNANIFIRSNLPSQHDKFVKAHLLGHFFIHIQPKLAQSEWRTGGFKEVMDPHKRFINQIQTPTDREQLFDFEADQFAAAILLPPGMLKRVYEAMKDIYKVAQFFDVTTELTAARLAQVGLIDRPMDKSPLHKNPEKSAGDKKRGLDRIREIAKNLERSR